MIRINLLPVREARRKATVRQQMLLLAASLIGAVVLSAGIHAWVRGSIGSARERVASLQHQLDQYKPQQKQVDEFKAKKAEIERKLAVIDRLERSRSGPVRIMDELSNHIPNRVWLTDLSADERQITLAGMSLDNELVASFLSRLDESPYFARVELDSTELKVVQSLKLNTFKVRAALESPEQPYVAEPAQDARPAGRRRGH